MDRHITILLLLAIVAGLAACAAVDVPVPGQVQRDEEPRLENDEVDPFERTIDTTNVANIADIASEESLNGNVNFFKATRYQEATSKLNASSLIYTYENGAPYWQPRGIQRAGPDGPMLMQDTHHIDTLAHFARERIPERVVHARGAAAHGYFEATTDFAEKYSVAEIFKKGTVTSTTIRFSTVIGYKGSADEARDPRGMAIKMRTKKGILDWVFNNTPVFFMRDPSKFPYFIHSQKPDPQTNTRNWDSYWEYLGRFPEAMLQFLRVWCDLGTPYGFRHMDSWSGNTYRLVAEDGSWVYTRVYLSTDQGIRNFTDAQAKNISGVNDAWATQDLYDSIQKGNYPSWTVYIQIKTQEEASRSRYNILDLTKDWIDSPYHEVGKFVLNQIPVNFFAEVEQLHFSVSNMIEGWEPSNDPMLQSRMFSYNDAGRYRLGPNYNDIPVNCPYSAMANYNRDGYIQMHGNQGKRVNFPAVRDDYRVIRRPRTSIDQPIRGESTEHFEWAFDPEIDWLQPRLFYNNLSPVDKQHTIQNIASSLILVQNEYVVALVLDRFSHVSESFADGIRAAMNDMKYNKQ